MAAGFSFGEFCRLPNRTGLFSMPESLIAHDLAP
jgi:hypothetical protein